MNAVSRGRSPGPGSTCMRDYDNRSLPLQAEGVGFVRNSRTSMNQAIRREFLERRDEIARICARLGVRRLEIFGSAVTGAGKRPGDLDFLVDLGDRKSTRLNSSHVKISNAVFCLKKKKKKK